MKIRRRPTRSPSRPPSTSNPANGSRLHVSTHCTAAEPTPRLDMTSGRASGTAVWSMRIMALASVIARSTSGAPARRVTSWSDTAAVFRARRPQERLQPVQGRGPEDSWRHAFAVALRALVLGARAAGVRLGDRPLERAVGARNLEEEFHDHAPLSE